VLAFPVCTVASHRLSHASERERERHRQLLRLADRLHLAGSVITAADDALVVRLAWQDLEHYGIFFQLFVLVVGMVAGYGLEQYHVTVVAEAGGVLMVGLIAGWLMTKDEETGLADDNAKELEHVATFDVNFFFLFLLPPIILDAGFNMDEMQRRKLFQNIGAVCCLAFGGTLISTIAMACIMHWFGSVAVVTEDAAGGAAFPEGMTWVESLVFGSLISATDPVTVLAIFGKMGADRDLYALVFGESVLNDAVAIVLCAPQQPQFSVPHALAHSWR
jgi:sodium/hydrogen exchanger 8